MQMVANQITLQKFIAGLTPAERRALAAWCRVEIARADRGPQGFAQFYYLVFGRELPRHAGEEWLPAIQRARREGQGALIEAFRGSTKTTTLTIAWTAFQIGHAPTKSVLVIQAGKEIAEDNVRQIAEIIAENRGWRRVFPRLRPDRKAGWSVTGYEVVRTDLPYGLWRTLCALDKGKDPSFLGLGYQSRGVIGRHPTGVLLVDDIHDENNTRSGRELEKVRAIVQGTILPTVTPETQIVFIGTPWQSGDVLAYLKSTGRFITATTPILRSRSPAGGNALAETSKPPAGRAWRPTWPEKFPPEEIVKLRALTGEKEFARMYLLDLKAAAGIHLRREWLHPYPAEKIDPRWPVVMGVDYASTADRLVDGQRDYFAVAIGRALPGGAGIVLVDGCREQLSQGEAEARLKQLAALYPTTQLIGVEAVGKGEEFYHLMLRTSRLPLLKAHPGRRSKGERFETGMAPLFEFRRVWIADIPTPFLRAFEEEWVRWPHGQHDDTLDAVYWMLYAGLPHMLGGDENKDAGKRPNPFLKFTRG